MVQRESLLGARDHEYVNSPFTYLGWGWGWVVMIHTALPFLLTNKVDYLTGTRPRNITSSATRR